MGGDDQQGPEGYYFGPRAGEEGVGEVHRGVVQWLSWSGERGFPGTDVGLFIISEEETLLNQPPHTTETYNPRSNQGN